MRSCSVHATRVSRMDLAQLGESTLSPSQLHKDRGNSTTSPMFAEHAIHNATVQIHEEQVPGGLATGQTAGLTLSRLGSSVERSAMVGPRISPVALIVTDSTPSPEASFRSIVPRTPQLWALASACAGPPLAGGRSLVLAGSALDRRLGHTGCFSSGLHDIAADSMGHLVVLLVDGRGVRGGLLNAAPS